jgi:hypothetical protein
VRQPGGTDMAQLVVAATAEKNQLQLRVCFQLSVLVSLI